MSVVTYGYIELQLVETENYSRDTVTSDDGIDLIYIRHNLTVRAVYNPQATSYRTGTTTPAPGLRPATTDVAIRQYLLTPRLPLTYGDGLGNTILQSPAVGNFLDAKGGPFPKSCNVVELRGTKTFLVDWTVETFMQECPGGASMAYPLVSTRWSQSHHIDSQHRTTITTQGVSVFRIDLLASIAKQADFFRDRCIPGTPNRYQRVDVNVTINPAGDTLTWSVVDQQPMYYLGDDKANNYGVVKFDADISEISVSASVGERQIPTGMIVAAFNITAIGAVDSSRAKLLEFCAMMAVSCLQLKAKPVNFDKDPIIKNVAIRDVITDRHISLRVEVFMPPNPNPPAGAGPLQTQLLGVDVIPGIANNDLAPQMPNGGNTRGQQLELLLTQAFQSPCADVSLPSAVGTASASNNANYLQGGGSSVNIRTGNILPAAPTKYNGAVIRKGPYSEYRVDIRTHRHHHKLQLPSTLPIPTALPPGYQPGGPGSTFGGSGGARPKAANVTVAAPTSTVVVTWTAERWGARPVLPAPVMSDDNYSIVDEVVDRASVEYHNDGQTPIYRISGEYRYLHASPEGAGDSLAMGSLPWTTDSFLDNVVQDTDYRHGIIDIGTTGDIA